MDDSTGRNEIDPRLLAALEAEMGQGAPRRDLWPAIQAGLEQPLSGVHLGHSASWLRPAAVTLTVVAGVGIMATLAVPQMLDSPSGQGASFAGPAPTRSAPTPTPFRDVTSGRAPSVGQEGIPLASARPTPTPATTFTELIDGGRVAPTATQAPSPAFAGEGSPGFATTATGTPPPTSLLLATPTPTVAGYDATFFENYGVNPFVDTAEDRFSTFAMDVDTASYTVARRFVSDGNLPDRDSVRVEEFINYFDQGYAPPSEVAFAIHVDGALSPFGDDGVSLMRVGLQGHVVDSEERKDASLVFVIDVSGSMGRGDRLGTVKESLKLLVGQLRATDEVGIVAYGSTGRVVLQPTGGGDPSTIIEAIESLTAGGSTYAEQGIRLGYEMAAEMQRPGRITRVMLLSDGVANVGNTGPEAILEVVGTGVASGITLSTLGFGMGNFNDVLMERLANDGNGNYAYIDTLAEARRVFVENLTGLLQVIARDAKIQLDFNPEVVQSYRLLGYENRDVADEDFRNDAVDAGEVGSGHSVTALYEVAFHEGAEGNAGTVFVRWEDPDSGAVFEIAQEFARSGLSDAFSQAAPRFQLATVVAEYAEVLRESFWAQGTSLGDVRRMAEGVAELLPDDTDVQEFLSLVSRAESISGGG